MWFVTDSLDKYMITITLHLFLEIARFEGPKLPWNISVRIPGVNPYFQHGTETISSHLGQVRAT